MSTNSYWDQVTQSRVGRRRLLKSGAAFSVGAAALALIGCGGDDDGDDDQASDAPASGATGDPKPGGSYNSSFTTIGNYNVAAFYHDGYNNSGITAYDRPITARADTKGYSLEAMEKIEVAEPTRVVMTLKPGLVYQNKAPVNGRKVLASDIVNYQNYVKGLANAENAQFQRTFLDRAEAPNDTTVVYHLKQPSAYLFSSTYLANPTAQPIVPEGDRRRDRDDPGGRQRPVRARRPHLRPEVRLQEVRKLPRSEERHALLHRTARRTASSTPLPRRPPSVAVKSANGRPRPRLSTGVMGELDKTKFSNQPFLALGQVGMNAMMNAQQGGPRPWHDMRFREAIYRLTNKQQQIDLAYARKAVINQGPLQAGLDAWHIDFKTAEPYYKEDVAAAKQLLSAMNYDTSKEWVVTCSNSNASNATLAEVWQQQLARADIKLRVESIPLAEILPNQLERVEV